MERISEQILPWGWRRGYLPGSPHAARLVLPAVRPLRPSLSADDHRSAQGPLENTCWKRKSVHHAMNIQKTWTHRQVSAEVPAQRRWFGLGLHPCASPAHRGSLSPPRRSDAATRMPAAFGTVPVLGPTIQAFQGFFKHVITFASIQ